MSIPRDGANGNRTKRRRKKKASTIRRGSVEELARRLGVTASALRNLGCARSDEYGGSWSFPMVSGDRQRSGEQFRLRQPDANGVDKKTGRGGKLGLFIPQQIPDDPQADEGHDRLIVVEGASSAAAALDLGLPAVGVPGAGQAAQHLIEFVAAMRPSEVIFIVDRDDAGMKGALKLAQRLAAEGHVVRGIYPPRPHKDLRDWTNADEPSTEQVLARLARAKRINPPAPPQHAAESAAAAEPAGPLDVVLSGQLLPEHARVLPVDIKDPLRAAELFLIECHFDVDRHRLTLRHHQQTFYRWTISHYAEMQLEDLRNQIYSFLRVRKDKDGKQLRPTKANVDNVVDAARALTHIGSSVEVPSWIGPAAHNASLPHPQDIMPCANGLLHVRIGNRPVEDVIELLDPTPDLFVTWSTEWRWDLRQQRNVQQWRTFLCQLFPHDRAARLRLQEIMGQLIYGDVSLELYMLLVGPRRAGKGTISTMASHVVGERNCAGLRLADLGTEFGSAKLVGKRLAIVEDHRSSQKGDSAMVAERLLNITGQDLIAVGRKYRDDWVGRLHCQFLIATNLVPVFGDAAGAIASRLVPLRFRRTFAGEEDRTLKKRLKTEVPAIAIWALLGYRRLKRRGWRFTAHSDSDAVIAELTELSTPIRQFAADRLVMGPGCHAPIDSVYRAWREWCQAEGRDKPGPRSHFSRDLLAAYSELRRGERMYDHQRKRAFLGVRLRHTGDDVAASDAAAEADPAMGPGGEEEADGE